MVFWDQRCQHGGLEKRMRQGRQQRFQQAFRQRQSWAQPSRRHRPARHGPGAARPLALPIGTRCRGLGSAGVLLTGAAGMVLPGPMELLLFAAIRLLLPSST